MQNPISRPYRNDYDPVLLGTRREEAPLFPLSMNGEGWGEGLTGIASPLILTFSPKGRRNIWVPVRPFPATMNPEFKSVT
jgi:hypothetical protein